MSKEVCIFLHNLELRGIDAIELHNAEISKTKTPVLNVTQNDKKYEYQIPEHQIIIKAPPDKEPRRSLDRALLVLNLFKPTCLFSNILTCAGYDIEFDELPHYQPWRKPDTYSIKEEEVCAFKIFWKEYFDKINFESSVFTFFRLAPILPYDTMTALFYSHCLEALFTPNGTGLKYKYAKRGALIIGDKSSVDNMTRLKLELEELYDFRSAIVHGRDFGQPEEGKLKDYRMFCFTAIQYYLKHDLIDNYRMRRNHNRQLNVNKYF
jgi:hypothetical protein